jgi:hypothetical protein
MCNKMDAPLLAQSRVTVRAIELTIMVLVPNDLWAKLKLSLRL